MYQSPNKSLWIGRPTGSDGEDGRLWHHVMQLLDLNTELPSGDSRNVALIGFGSDEGVRRNLGRVGAKEGPTAIRKALCNLAVHFDPESFKLFDAGDVICEGQKLEEASAQCAGKVSALLEKGYFPIILGGGHESTYAHFSGLKNSFEGKKIGVINLDPHFDMRTYEKGQHSGSWARQIADEADASGGSFHYLPIGISQSVNNQALFKVMQKHGQQFISMNDVVNGITPDVKAGISSFMSKVDYVCFTVDLDVLSAAHAPGVSAPAAFGLSPEATLSLIREVVKYNKVVSMDISELNPTFDDGRTAKLAALFVYQVAMSKV